LKTSRTVRQMCLPTWEWRSSLARTPMKWPFFKLDWLTRCWKLLEWRDCNAKPTQACTTPLGTDAEGPRCQLSWDYASVIGMLMYLTLNSQPHIQFIVHQCARFTHNPRASHEQAVLQICHYLKGWTVMAIKWTFFWHQVCANERECCGTSQLAHCITWLELIDDGELVQQLVAYWTAARVQANMLDEYCRNGSCHDQGVDHRQDWDCDHDYSIDKTWELIW